MSNQPPDPALASMAAEQASAEPASANGRPANGTPANTAPPPTPSALRWFQEHLGSVRYLYYTMAVFLAAPVVAEYLLSMGPPHLIFAQRVALTSAIGFLAIMICYARNFDVKTLPPLTRKTYRLGLAGMILLVAYLGLVQSFSEYNEIKKERVLIGLWYQPNIERGFEPGIRPIVAAGWDPRLLYVPWTIALVENLALGMWCLTIACISTSFSYFSLQQDLRMIRTGKGDDRKRGRS